MRLPRPNSRVRFCIYSLLSLLFLMQAPLAAGNEPLTPAQPPLESDVRSRLAEGAADPTLEPWQREFMRGLAQDGRVDAAVGTPLALPGFADPSAGVATEGGTWVSFADRPAARSGHSAIYDPVRDRMVVFGGIDANGGRCNDVWVLSLAGSPAWTALTPAGAPPTARQEHTAIYDPVRDRMLVFGGFGSGYLNDVWSLSLAGSPAWSALAVAGSPPTARSWHTAIYDPVRDRMVVFGGSDGSRRNDVWALSLAGSPSWTALAPAGSPPAARYSHSAIYDPVRDRMLVFGGYGSGSLNDVWALSLAGSPAWTALAPSGSLPIARDSHTAIYDPVRDRMVAFGGYGGVSPQRQSDVWALSLAGSPAWINLAPTGSGVSARFGHTAIYDPVRDRMVVFGGNNGSLTNDTRALSLAGSPVWAELAPVGISPGLRTGHTAIYDPVRDRMLVFGGTANSVWALSLAGTPAWTALSPAGSPPPARHGHTAIYDPVRDRMLVFGGASGSIYWNDLWELSLSGSPAWTLLTPAGSPPSARCQHTAVYDPVRDCMVVFGGSDGTNYRNDVWALSLAASPAWSALAPGGSPPSARYGHAAIYDLPRDRMLVFGGVDLANVNLNDVWVLSLAGSPAWSVLAPAGSPPTGRSWHTAIYDRAGDRMVVFGGCVVGVVWDEFGAPSYTYAAMNDTWALTLAGSAAWSVLAPAGSLPPGRYQHTAIYDRSRGSMVVFGGSNLGDAWSLGWGNPVSVDTRVPGLRLGSPRPNPSRGETHVDFELGKPARVVIDVFDAQGRRVNRIADEWFAAGRHVRTWRGDDQDGKALESGVYFIRMQGDGFRGTRRTVRIR